MTTEKGEKKGARKGVEYPRKGDGTLDCERLDGDKKRKCIVQRTKEGASKNLKQAMGVKTKPKEAKNATPTTPSE